MNADELSSLMEAQSKLAESGHGTLSRVVGEITSAAVAELGNAHAEIKRLQHLVDNPIYHYCNHDKVVCYPAMLCSMCGMCGYTQSRDFNPAQEVARLHKVITDG